jgi:hypothetical protein
MGQIQPKQTGRSSGEASVLRVPLVGLKREPAMIRAAVYAFRAKLESELMAKGGSGGVAVASKVHTACIAVRRHLAAERLLSKAGHPGEPGCTLSLEQWQAIADRALRWKETVDRCLSALGLDVKAEPLDWYDRLQAELEAEDRQRERERLAATPPAAASDTLAKQSNAQRQNGQPIHSGSPDAECAKGNGI